MSNLSKKEYKKFKKRAERRETKQHLENLKKNPVENLAGKDWVSSYFSSKKLWF